METSLHRALKEHYAEPGARFEVPLQGFRIDVVCGRRLIEIQHGTLSAIRDKVRRLLVCYRVTVVKPIVAGKLLVKLDRRGGTPVARRRSPKRGSAIDVFQELIHFTRIFPHPRLTLEVPLVQIEERRYPGHGRRRWRRATDQVVEDQALLAIDRAYRLRTPADVARLIACPLPDPFHTAHLAEGLGVPRWFAQQIAYCLRKIGAASVVGKQGNARLYAWETREGRTPLAKVA